MHSEENIVLNLLCLDRYGKTLFEKRDLIQNKKIEEISQFSLASSKNNKIVFICIAENHSNQTDELFFLRSFDENLNLLAKIKLDKEPIDCETNGENLFLFNINEKCWSISMYNHKLEIVQKFGQENSLIPYFFSPRYYDFFVSNQYFIFNEIVIETKDHKHDCPNKII